ncbi:MAG: SDR family oxidoreductase [Taibaiella sp.]|nr:SDR family oxidoreductase [Taibaiella sp.]
MHFKDKIIWITGASSGIGAELARKLAKQGAKLILTGRNTITLEQVKLECTADTGHINILQADLSKENELVPLADKAVNIYGVIDIAIHTAGVSQRSLAINTSVSIDRRLMEINFFAPVTITKALMPQFLKQGHGHVVAVSSMAGLMGFPMRTGYSAAKHAVMGFFETLQVEHTIPGFYITIVSPGRINTPISLSALNAAGEAYNVMDKGQLNGIPVDECAEKILKSIRGKKRHVIIARGERILWLLRLLIPPLYYKIARSKGMK